LLEEPVKRQEQRLEFLALSYYESEENNLVSRKLLPSLIDVSPNNTPMTVATLGRMLVDDEVFKKVKTELMNWAGVTSQPHRFG
jgi:hypothetical protein